MVQWFTGAASRTDPIETGREIEAPGSYQRLDLFMKVLTVLCPNLTDDSHSRKEKIILCLSNIVGLCSNNSFILGLQDDREWKE